MGTLVTNKDGLQLNYGTRDVEVNYARAVGGVDSVQKVVFDIKGYFSRYHGDDQGRSGLYPGQLSYQERNAFG